MGLAAGPPLGKVRPRGGQRSTRSDKRGGLCTSCVSLRPVLS